MALGKSIRKSFYRLALAIIIIFLLCMLYYHNDPSVTDYFPKCPFYTITGIKCPGCGSQRMLHNLLHLRVSEALRCNLLFVVLIPTLLFTITVRKYKRQFPICYRTTIHPAYSTTILIVIVLWWIMRNIFGL